MTSLSAVKSLSMCGFSHLTLWLNLYYLLESLWIRADNGSHFKSLSKLILLSSLTQVRLSLDNTVATSIASARLPNTILHSCPQKHIYCLQRVHNIFCLPRKALLAYGWMMYTVWNCHFNSKQYIPVLHRYLLTSSSTIRYMRSSATLQTKFRFFVQTFITVVLIELYYADAFCHSVTIKRIWWWWARCSNI